MFATFPWFNDLDLNMEAKYFARFAEDSHTTLAIAVRSERQ